jgi:hypothetical protein
MTSNTVFFSSVRLLAALALTHLLMPSAAHAYIDPISGSVFLQALIAVGLGGLLSIKRVSFAISEFFSRVWKRIAG